MLPDLIFIGPSGSGKGTQAKVFHDRYGYQVIGMGQILRERAQKNDPLGKRIHEIITRGDLVPDEIFITLLKEHLQEIPAEIPLIFDGLPREVYQAKLLEELRVHTDHGPAVPVYLKLNPDEAMRRLMSRRVCQNCGAIAHASDTESPIRCFNCGELLTIREDDRPEIITHRLETFQKQTLPVIQYYARKNRLHTIDADGSVEDVTRRIEAAANLHEKNHGNFLYKNN